MKLIDRIPQRWRWPAGIAAVTAIYLIALQLPGTGDWLQKNAPLAVIVIGLITGTVTALLAIGLILIYRANRFINFAYGAMGSLVGVIGMGLYLDHGWPFFVMLPVGVVAGALVGVAVEFLVIRRFYNASRLVLTVASIGL